MESIGAILIVVLSLVIFVIVLDFLFWVIIPAAIAVRRTRKEKTPDDWFNLIQ